MISNGGFGSDADWISLKLWDSAPDGIIDFNYTSDGPSAGEGPALRMQGDTDAHNLVYQTVAIQQGVTYSIAGAVKDISGTALDCNWCQFYVSTVEPVEGEDYTPNDDRYLTFDSWEGSGAYSGAGIDGTFEDDANRYGNDTTFVLVPGPLGEIIDVHYGIKVGSCGATFDWLFDNLSLQYVGVQEPTAIDETGRIEIPEVYALNQNYPNPFNPSTTISFRMKAAEKVSLTVYDVMGRQVRTLLNNEMNQGTHMIIWNGRSNNGEQVSSGVYFYTLRVGEKLFTKKMMLMK
jgi:hypothetical protein